MKIVQYPESFFGVQRPRVLCIDRRIRTSDHDDITQGTLLAADELMFGYVEAIEWVEMAAAVADVIILQVVTTQHAALAVHFAEIYGSRFFVSFLDRSIEQDEYIRRMILGRGATIIGHGAEAFDGIRKAMQRESKPKLFDPPV